MNVTTTAFNGPTNTRTHTHTHRAPSRPQAVLLGLCLSAGLLAGCGGSLEGSEDSNPSLAAVQADGFASDTKSADEGRAGTSGNDVELVDRGTGSSPDTAAPTGSAPATDPAPAPGAAPAPPPSGNPDASKPAPTPSPTPTPKPSPPPAASTINSIDTIVNDMKLKNDLVLAGVNTNGGWATGPGQVVLGNDPRGTHTPSWWNPNNKSFKSSAYWNVILPWFVVFDGVGNSASNTRVQLRNLVLYIKSKKTGQWKLIRRSTGVSGELFPKTLQGDNVSKPNVRTESDGSTAVLPPSGNLVYHGWGSMDDIDGSDIGALMITLQARLVKDVASGSDDRAKAKYLVHVGADYYPTRTTRVADTAPAYYFPGTGVSRAKMVSNDWQAYSFSTIDVGVEDPGGGVITEAEFRANPPPLE